MMRIITPLVLVVATLCGLALLDDAATFGLMPADPHTGRERGCYTWLDLLVGAKQPQELARFGEAVGGGTLLVLPLAFMAGRWRRGSSVRSLHGPLG